MKWNKSEEEEEEDSNARADDRDIYISHGYRWQNRVEVIASKRWTHQYRMQNTQQWIFVWFILFRFLLHTHRISVLVFFFLFFFFFFSSAVFVSLCPFIYLFIFQTFISGSSVFRVPSFQSSFFNVTEWRCARPANVSHETHQPILCYVPTK